MPLIHEGDSMPDWCELRSYAIHRLDPGKTIAIDFAAASKHVVIVARGRVAIDNVNLGEGAIANLTRTTGFTAGPDGATIVSMTGHWGDEYGGLGIFGLHETEDPHNAGDPVDYPRRTSFDSHFHDCDEYWIMFEGRGVAVSEGIAFKVGPGDCIATGMGQHHDFPEASEPVRAVFFETTMEGEKRRGHLWEHIHGPAEPHPDRV